MSGDCFARQQAAWDCLRWFDRTPRTEAEFRTRMEKLPEDDLTLLRAFYGVTDDRDLLAVICRFWDVPASRTKAG